MQFNVHGQKIIPNFIFYWDLFVEKTKIIISSQSSDKPNGTIFRIIYYVLFGSIVSKIYISLSRYYASF